MTSLKICRQSLTVSYNLMFTLDIQEVPSHYAILQNALEISVAWLLAGECSASLGCFGSHPINAPSCACDRLLPFSDEPMISSSTTDWFEYPLSATYLGAILQQGVWLIFWPYQCKHVFHCCHMIYSFLICRYCGNAKNFVSRKFRKDLHYKTNK